MFEFRFRFVSLILAVLSLLSLPVNVVAQTAQFNYAQMTLGGGFSSPQGVAVDTAGNIYIAETGNNKIRKVTVATGVITTVAGNGVAGYYGDGASATSAYLDQPYGVAVDAGGIYIADTGNNVVRGVAASNGYIYGESQVIEVELLVECIMFRSWTEQLMPDAVKISLGGTAPATGG